MLVTVATPKLAMTLSSFRDCMTLLTLFLIKLDGCSCKVDPIISRSHSFEDFHNGFRLNVNSWETFNTITGSSYCAFLCSKAPECISFNFCRKLICELNRKDKFSRGVELKGNVDCIYRGMERPKHPSCAEGSNSKEITDDSDPG